jgi:pimeloyl-ACP methyl ester carboxylesterase
VLLFLHSFPTWSFIYRNIIKNLKSNFRCIALDYPGFGLSKPSDGFIHTLKNHSEMKGYLTEVKQGLGHLRVLPALLIFGNEDPTFEAGFMNRFEQIFSRSHSVILKGAGHFTPEEAPDEITSVIKSWWQSLQEQV